MKHNEQTEVREPVREVFGMKELEALSAKPAPIVPEDKDTEVEKNTESPCETPIEDTDSAEYDREAERKEKNEQLRLNFDHLAAYEPHTWSHNTRYLPKLLKHINPLVGGMAVDVFCQRGDLTRTLSGRFSKVIGIDLSPKMIEIAKQKSANYDNITYVCGDFMEYDIPENSCGLITMVASLHHLPQEEAIAKAKRCLKRAGRLVIVDMYRPATLGDLFSSLIATPLNAIGVKFIDKHKASAEEMSYWRIHRSLDWYSSIPEMKKFAKTNLPDAKITRKLFWRYTLEWVKP